MPSNIRTLNDLGNSRGRQDDEEARPLNQQWRGSGGVNLGTGERVAGPPQSSFANQSGKKSARDEGFFESLKVNLCPKFSVLSVLFIISFIQIAVFTVELIVGGIDHSTLLGANP
jgi:hypothetical protein